MSLSKLACFINKRYQWRSVSLKDEIIVIKGDALCYFLYCKNHRWQDGGHYHEFYRTVKEFFDKLKEQDTYAYVIMNGANTGEENHQTRCVEKLNRIKDISILPTSVQCSVLPLFAKTVFVDALRDCDIRFVVADGDGDPDCVALANHLECPVLADDADFYIFNIHNGYIPLRDSSGSFIDVSASVRCYVFTAFDTQLGFQSHDQRLYIPFLLKRDPHPERNFKVFEVCRYIEGLLETIQEKPMYCGYERIEQAYEIGEEMQTLRSFYRVTPTAYNNLVCSRDLELLNSAIPEWIFQAYRMGKFDLTMMHALVNRGYWRYSCVIEDTKKCSAWSVANKPRLFMQGILSRYLSSGNVMCEAKRSGVPFSIVASKVQLKDKHNQIRGEIVSTESVVSMPNIFLKCFNCKHIQSSLSAKIPAEFKLATIVTRAWLKTDKEKLEPLVAPLVFCILSCAGRYSMPQCVRKECDDIYDLDLLHSFAQWQCLLYHAIALNQLLQCPFEYTSLARLFSCSVVEYYHCNPPPRPFEQLPSIMIDLISIV